MSCRLLWSFYSCSGTRSGIAPTILRKEGQSFTISSDRRRKGLKERGRRNKGAGEGKGLEKERGRRNKGEWATPLGPEWAPQKT
jgi:hypothetical protein